MARQRKAHPPGILTSEEAARRLGVSKDRIYQFVSEGRLPHSTFGNAFMFRVEDVDRIKRNPSGRKQTKIRLWRTYKGNVKVLTTEIVVPVRAGQQKRLHEKLQFIRKSEQHVFPGTLDRYVIAGDGQLNSLHISLYWKSTSMPDESEFQQYLDAFQAELADVLDWEMAEVHTREALLYT